MQEEGRRRRKKKDLNEEDFRYLDLADRVSS